MWLPTRDVLRMRCTVLSQLSIHPPNEHTDTRITRRDERCVGVPTAYMCKSVVSASKSVVHCVCRFARNQTRNARMKKKMKFGYSYACSSIPTSVKSNEGSVPATALRLHVKITPQYARRTMPKSHT